MRLIFIILLLCSFSNVVLADDPVAPDGYVHSDNAPLRLRVGPGLRFDVIDRHERQIEGQ